VATYAQWNDALTEYFTYGAPVGSTIYLNVNDQALELIGAQFWGATPVGGWGEDFLRAVRQALIHRGRVVLHPVEGRDARGRPLGVAFLGVLVLVATRMDRDTEQGISERDYFTRLGEALGTEPANQQVRRPKGMTSGAEGEEPLWLTWAAYLRRRGYLPTATGGKGAWRYIGYAVSQTLVREPEKRRLYQIFEARGWGAEPDPEWLVQRLRGEEVPAHVQRLLEREGQAAEDVAHALGEVYREWYASRGEGGTPAAARLLSRHLTAGLYRTEHYRTGAVRYSLFPRQPRGLRLLEVTAELPEGPVRLQLERPGYYAPLGDLDAAGLRHGLSLALSGHPHLNALVLPARDFWLLRADPDNAGAFASLGRPEVGEHFLLLIRSEFQEALERLREQGLLQWQDATLWQEGWLEVAGVMVTANHWADAEGLAPRELLDALRPGSGLSLSLTGGLRVPQAGAWVANGPPSVTVASFFTEAFLSVRRGSEAIYAQAVEPNQPVLVPWGGPGDYELEAEARGQSQVRLVKLLDWDELPAPPMARLGQEALEWGRGAQTLRLVGPVVSEPPWEAPA
jgi:hypothetical protein